MLDVLDTCRISIHLKKQSKIVLSSLNFRQAIGDKTQKRHFMYPWEFTERVPNIDQDVALVFGEEGSAIQMIYFAVIILSHFRHGAIQ